MPLYTGQRGLRAAIIGNGNRPPSYYQSASGTILNQGRKYVVSRRASFSSVRMTFPGFYQYGGGEFPITAPFSFRASVLYDGSWYPLTFVGSRDYTMLPGNGYLTSDPIRGFEPKAGSEYFVAIRRILNAPGDRSLISYENDPAFGEWSYVGSDPAIDYTGGVGLPYGAAGYFTFDTLGNITSLVTTVAGSNYTGSYLPVTAFDPDSGAHSGTLIANIGVTLGVNSVGTTGAGSLVNTTGKGPNTVPVYCDVRHSNGSLGSWGPCLTVGVPSVDCPSLLIPGDSNVAGYTASDLVGDDCRNYGMLERAIGNRVGVAILAYSGAAASSLITESALPTCHSILDGIPTHVLWQAGANDIGLGATAGAIKTTLRKAKALWRARGCQVSFSTPVVRTTGDYSTNSGQIPSPGFAAGKAGAIDDVTNAIRWQLDGLRSDFGMFDTRSSVEDQSIPNVWKPGYTLDGGHPGGDKGLRLSASQIVLPYDLL